jgi:hypothetical protein
MRTKLFGVALALALVIPATAFASKVNLTGTVDTGGVISMTVKHSSTTHKYKVINLKFSGVKIHCTAQDSTVGADTTGFVFKVAKDGTFGATLVPTSGQDNKLKISGTLTHKGHKAAGVLQIKGDGVDTDDGRLDGCNTGKRDWKAKAA